jgi:tetratricopeptide (TPR) repeat protein
MGYEALVQGEYAKAAELLEAAVQRDPSDVGSLVNLGIAYQHLDRVAEALNRFKQAVRADSSMRSRIAPSITAILTNQAYAATEADDWGQAEKLVDEALLWNGQDGYAWRLRGGIDARKNKFDDAIKAYETARAFSPDAAYSHDQFVHDAVGLEIRSKRYEPAAKRLREALAASPENAEFWFLLGQCLEAGGSKEDAIEAYSRAARSAEYEERATRAAKPLREK